MNTTTRTCATCAAFIEDSIAEPSSCLNLVSFIISPGKSREPGPGDSVAMAGALTPKVWTDREGNARPALDIVAAQVLTPYHVTRKRKAVANDGTPDSFTQHEYPADRWEES